MKRLLLVVLALVGCTQVTTGTPVEVYAHCGLEAVYLEFDGAVWRFEESTSASRPFGWATDLETVYVERVGDRVVAHGPEGKDWGLVEMAAPVPVIDCL